MAELSESEVAQLQVRMESAFKHLFDQATALPSRADSDLREERMIALTIARRYMPISAITAAGAVYFALGEQGERPISIADPNKRPIFAAFGKPLRFPAQRDVVGTFRLAMTQKVDEERASAIATLPYLMTNLEGAIRQGMTMAEFKAMAPATLWAAHQLNERIARDIAGLPSR